VKFGQALGKPPRLAETQVIRAGHHSYRRGVGCGAFISPETTRTWWVFLECGSEQSRADPYPGYASEPQPPRSVGLLRKTRHTMDDCSRESTGLRLQSTQCDHGRGGWWPMPARQPRGGPAGRGNTAGLWGSKAAGMARGRPPPMMAAKTSLPRISARYCFFAASWGRGYAGSARPGVGQPQRSIWGQSPTLEVQEWNETW